MTSVFPPRRRAFFFLLYLFSYRTVETSLPAAWAYMDWSVLFQAGRQNQITFSAVIFTFPLWLTVTHLHQLKNPVPIIHIIILV